jgi:O-antigen/teichoic acid export membrane protein
MLLVSSVFFSIVLIVMFLFVLPEIEFKTRVLVAVLAVFPVLFNSNSLLANHLFPLQSKPKPLVFRNLIASVSGLGVLFILIYQYKLGYLGFVASAACSALVSFLLFIKPLWIKEKIFPRVEKNMARVKKNLKQSFPVIPHALGFVFLASSSRIIMSWYGVSIKDIGLFSNGYMMGDYITIITLAVVTSIVPKIQELYRKKEYIEFRKYYYFAQGVAIISTVLFSIWLPEIYKFLIRNQELQPGNVIARYICFANTVLPLYLFMSGITFIEKKAKQLLWLVFVPGIINVVLCIVLIPIYGYRVVVITTVISYWSQIFIPFFVGYFKVKTKLWLGSLSKLMILFMMLFSLMLISFQISNMAISFKIFFTLIILVLTIIFLNKFSSNKEKK